VFHGCTDLHGLDGVPAHIIQFIDRPCATPPPVAPLMLFGFVGSWWWTSFSSREGGTRGVPVALSHISLVLFLTADRSNVNHFPCPECPGGVMRACFPVPLSPAKPSLGSALWRMASPRCDIV